MKNILQKTFLTMLLGIILMGLSGCNEQTKQISSVDTAMGTVISQQLYVKDVTIAEAEEMSVEIIDVINQLEADTLSWRIEESELAKINAAGGSDNLSPQMEELLIRSIEVSEKSQGAFDITIGRVSLLWNLDEWADKWQVEKYALPKQEALEKELAQTGYENIVLWKNTTSQEDAPMAVSLKNQITLDLGAVGKGIALDEIKTYLEAKESITGAVISAGGSILTYGEKSDGSPWKIGVVDPFNKNRNLGTLSLTGQWCVSTSGDYERFVEVDGVRYHHIMDPATGYPADSGVRSVTILCKDGFLSDALSTACFILGPQKGMELAEHYQVEALFVDDGGVITMTEGMKKYFHLSDEPK